MDMNRMAFEQLIKDRYGDMTASERMIANYLLENIRDIPFETAKSISGRVGVSPMTVGRFLKGLGYAKLNTLKDELRGELTGAPWLTEEALTDTSTDERLATELGAIAAVHRLSKTAIWRNVTTAICDAANVYVAGFQTEIGLATSLAGHLSYLRPNAAYIDAGLTGSYAQITLDAGPGDCVILLERRRYSRHFRKVAEMAAQRRTQLVMISDIFCPWAKDLTEMVLTAETRIGHFSDANTAVCSLINLLVDDVTRRLGPTAKHRLEAVAERYEDLVGFQGARSSPSKSGD
jgi:DNA-binding MurR/RpiR family transcriptional regulator